MQAGGVKTCISYVHMQTVCGSSLMRANSVLKQFMNNEKGVHLRLLHVDVLTKTAQWPLLHSVLLVE